MLALKALSQKLFFMAREISAGIIIFRRTNEGPKFLLLYHGHNYWNFAKGKIESEERSLQTALREVEEETGIKPEELRIKKYFKEYEKFTFFRQKEKIYKIVILYLAETKQPIVKVSREHDGYAWLGYHEAMRLLTKFKDSQMLLKKAYDFMRQEQKRRAKPPEAPAEEDKTKTNQ